MTDTRRRSCHSLAKRLGLGLGLGLGLALHVE